MNFFIYLTLFSAKTLTLFYYDDDDDDMTNTTMAKKKQHILTRICCDTLCERTVNIGRKLCACVLRIWYRLYVCVFVETDSEAEQNMTCLKRVARHMY